MHERQQDKNIPSEGIKHRMPDSSDVLAHLQRGDGVNDLGVILREHERPQRLPERPVNERYEHEASRCEPTLRIGQPHSDKAEDGVPAGLGFRSLFSSAPWLGLSRRRTSTRGAATAQLLIFLRLVSQASTASATHEEQEEREGGKGEAHLKSMATAVAPTEHAAPKLQRRFREAMEAAADGVSGSTIFRRRAFAADKCQVIAHKRRLLADCYPRLMCGHAPPRYVFFVLFHQGHRRRGVSRVVVVRGRPRGVKLLRGKGTAQPCGGENGNKDIRDGCSGAAAAEDTHHENE
mmetsp:Transcript_29573/g.80918  ORF Transcript_29573/g.80918 Transcript_29573/m.80918 type:complete len:292 (-) Transcript_29573:84-959(-)